MILLQGLDVELQGLELEVGIQGLTDLDHDARVLEATGVNSPSTGNQTMPSTPTPTTASCGDLVSGIRILRRKK